MELKNKFCKTEYLIKDPKNFKYSYIQILKKTENCTQYIIDLQK